MKYRQFIEDYFLIDEPETGRLVPFKFRKIQIVYYLMLVALGLEKLGIALPLREFIVKARREGFSSLILAIFAADDILQENPTETQVISYKDDATNVFRKRYRRYILSYFARKSGVTVEEIQSNPDTLEKFAKTAFSVDANDLELRHNRAHFFCGTAAARTGGRGGVLQKLLFSESAHYQDTERMTAKEIIEGTAQQVDKSSGWIFNESTANGKGNYHCRMFEAIKRGTSRYILRFFGWRDFYTEKQYKVIASEITDDDLRKQEYPETIEEAFLSSNLSFTNENKLLSLVDIDANKSLHSHLELQGVNYIDQAEVIKDFLLVLERSSPHYNFYVGIDTAKSIDRTVVTVLKSKEVSPRGGIKSIAIDSTGQGDFMPDWFEKNTRWYLHRVKFSLPVKSVIYKNLLVVIEEKLTSLPAFLVDGTFISEEWQRFYSEMLDLQKEIKGNLIVVHHPTGDEYHDDYSDSWALAEVGYTVINGVPKGQRPPEAGSNFDNAVRRLLDTKGRRRIHGRSHDV